MLFTPGLQVTDVNLDTRITALEENEGSDSNGICPSHEYLTRNLEKTWKLMSRKTKCTVRGFCRIHISLIKLLKVLKVWTLGAQKCEQVVFYDPNMSLIRLMSIKQNLDGLIQHGIIYFCWYTFPVMIHVYYHSYRSFWRSPRKLHFYQ